MRLYNDSPNFTIIAPGGCNAKCSFCFWEQEETMDRDDYLVNLANTITSLPKQFWQVSISGGEPCLSPYISNILQLLDYVKKQGRICKVVLTTNGTGLKELIPEMKGVVDYVNISRHHYYDNKNQEIYGVKTVPSKKEIKELNTLLNQIGIESNMNCVITDHISDTEDVRRMISFAKEHNYSSIAFRHQHGVLEAPEIERGFDNWVAQYEGECPVCRSKVQLINGMRVAWKSSLAEPKEAFDEDVVYELVHHPGGNVTADWEGEKSFTLHEGVLYSNEEFISKVKSSLLFEEEEEEDVYVSSSVGCGIRSGC